MSSKRPPKQPSLAAMLWDMLRLGVRAIWSSQANPVRPLLARQQALTILGLPPNATRQQIKRRYRMLAKQHHPDRGGNPREMQRIIAAYELLMKDMPQ